jgi:hypothetical protein
MSEAAQRLKFAAFAHDASRAGQEKDHAMRKAIVLALTALALAGCQNSVAVQREREVVGSMQFDTVPCGELTQRRNQLAAQHGLSPDVEREPQQESLSAGFDLVIPDGRSDAARSKARAIGEITAMNNSMKRRNCGAA